MWTRVGRRVGRVAVAMMVIGLGIAAIAPPARACTCGRVGLIRSTVRADAVFVGMPVRASSPGPNQWGVYGNARRYTFEVEQIYKGTVVDTVEVVTATSDAGCGYPFKLGKRYLVFAYASGDSLVTSNCTLTGPATQRTDVLEYLDGLPVHGDAERVNRAVAEGLRDSLGSSNPRERLYAADLFGAIPEPGLREEVAREGVASSDPAVRRTTVLIWKDLIWHEHASALPIIDLVADPDPRVRAAAVEALPAAQNQPDSVFAALEAALAGPSTPLQEPAVQSRIGIGPHESPCWDILQKIWAGDPSDTVRAAALTSLVHARFPTARATPIVQAAAQDTGAVVRKSAMRVLAEETFRDSVWAAVARARLLADSDSTLRQAVARSLTKDSSDVWTRVPPAEVLPYLERASRDDDLPVFRAAFHILGLMKFPGAAEVVVRTLDDPSPYRQISALFALGELGSIAKGTLPALRRYRDGLQGGRRKLAETAIARIEDPAGER